MILNTNHQAIIVVVLAVAISFCFNVALFHIQWRNVFKSFTSKKLKK
jgi:hypothetical protein